METITWIVDTFRVGKKKTVLIWGSKNPQVPAGFPTLILLQERRRKAWNGTGVTATPRWSTKITEICYGGESAEWKAAGSAGSSGSNPRLNVLRLMWRLKRHQLLMLPGRLVFSHFIPFLFLHYSVLRLIYAFCCAVVLFAFWLLFQAKTAASKQNAHIFVFSCA